MFNMTLTARWGSRRLKSEKKKQAEEVFGGGGFLPVLIMFEPSLNKSHWNQLRLV